MDMELNLEEVLACLSLTGKLEWDLALKRAENDRLYKKLAHRNGAEVEEEALA